MRRGRQPGSGEAQARLLAVLRAQGQDLDGRQKPLRSAELAARAKVVHGALYKAMQPLVELGQVTACLVQPAKGNKTYEYRIGPGVPPKPQRALDVRRDGVAKAAHRGAEALPKPIPRLSPVAGTPVKRLPVPVMDDAAMLAVVQGMTEAEFGEYVGHLARVWSWGRMRRSA